MTKENVEEYISRYSHQILHESVAPQFDAFHSGFQQVQSSGGRNFGMSARHKPELQAVSVQTCNSWCRHSKQVCDGPAMGLLFPDELELLVCGMRDMDFLVSSVRQNMLHLAVWTGM